MPDLEFKIKTSADLAAAKESSLEIEKTGKSAEKAGGHAEMSARSFRQLAHALGEEIPGSAALMESAFEGAENKMLGSAFLLLAGIEMLKASIEKINKEREQSVKIEEEMADADAKVSDAVEKQKAALESAEIAEAEFHHSFIRNTQNAIDQAERLAEVILKSSSSADESEAGRRNQIAAQNIDEMEQRGVVSHATALKLKEQLDIEYERQRMLRMMAMDKLEEVALSRQKYNKEIALRGSEQTENSAENLYKNAATAKAANESKIEQARERIRTGEDAKKALRDTGVTDDTVQQLNEFVTKHGGDDSASLSEKFHFAAMKNLGIGPGSFEANRIVKLFGSQGDRNLALYEGANIDIAAGKKELAKATGRAPELSIAEGNAKSDLDNARQEMQKLRDQVRELTDKLDETRTSNAIKESSAQVNLGMSKANAALLSDRTIADNIQIGVGVSGADAQKMMADASAISGHQVDLKTAAQIIESGANNIGAFMGQIDRLTTSFSKLNPQDMRAVNGKIELLEIQVARLMHHPNIQ